MPKHTQNEINRIEAERAAELRRQAGGGRVMGFTEYPKSEDEKKVMEILKHMTPKDIAWALVVAEDECDAALEREQALAAHVERAQGVASQIRGYTLPDWRRCLNMLLGAVEENPTTSLARQKAQWQAEALEEAAALYSHEWKDEFAEVAVSIMRKGRGYIYPEGLAERAAELRRQAEEKTP